LDRLANIRQYAPTIRTGYLAKEVNDELLTTLLRMGVEELCPRAPQVTTESVEAWHRMGFNVRAWGVSSEELMRTVYDSGADGMTVNFPDRLVAYVRACEEKVEEKA
jgi:glycerophosphoryl diester phosphodiesterase